MRQPERPDHRPIRVVSHSVFQMRGLPPHVGGASGLTAATADSGRPGPEMKPVRASLGHATRAGVYLRQPDRPPYRFACCRRSTFQISPHAPHRQ